MLRPGHRRASTRIASAILRLLGVRPQDEVSSTFTREEVAALVEESRGEGLIRPEEYDRLAGALGFTEKTVVAVLMPRRDADHGRRGVDRRRRRGAVRDHRLQPVPGRRATDGELLGYLHIKDVLEPDEPRRQQLDRGQVDPPVRDGRGRRPAARCARDAAAPRRAHGPGRRRRRGHASGWSTLEDVIEELVGEIRDAAHPDEARAPGRLQCDR